MDNYTDTFRAYCSHCEERTLFERLEMPSFEFTFYLMHDRHVRVFYCPRCRNRKLVLEGETEERWSWLLHMFR